MANRWIEFVRKWAAKAGISYACAVSKPECRAEYQAKYGNRKNLPRKTEREMMGAEDIRSQAVRTLEKQKKKKPALIIEDEEEYIITPKKKAKKPKRSQKAVAAERVSPKLEPVMERLKALQDNLQSQMAQKKEMTANLRGKLAKELKTVLDEKKRLVELSRMMGEDRNAPDSDITYNVFDWETDIKMLSNELDEKLDFNKLKKIGEEIKEKKGIYTDSFKRTAKRDKMIQDLITKFNNVKKVVTPASPKKSFSEMTPGERTEYFHERYGEGFQGMEDKLGNYIIFYLNPLDTRGIQRPDGTFIPLKEFEDELTDEEDELYDPYFNFINKLYVMKNAGKISESDAGFQLINYIGTTMRQKEKEGAPEITKDEETKDELEYRIKQLEKALERINHIEENVSKSFFQARYKSDIEYRKRLKKEIPILKKRLAEMSGEKVTTPAPKAAKKKAAVAAPAPVEGKKADIKGLEETLKKLNKEQLKSVIRLLGDKYNPHFSLHGYFKESPKKLKDEWLQYQSFGKVTSYDSKDELVSNVMRVVNGGVISEAIVREFISKEIPSTAREWDTQDFKGLEKGDIVTGEYQTGEKLFWKIIEVRPKTFTAETEKGARQVEGSLLGYTILPKDPNNDKRFEEMKEFYSIETKAHEAIKIILEEKGLYLPIIPGENEAMAEEYKKEYKKLAEGINEARKAVMNPDGFGIDNDYAEDNLLILLSKSSIPKDTKIVIKLFLDWIKSRINRIIKEKIWDRLSKKLSKTDRTKISDIAVEMTKKSYSATSKAELIRQIKSDFDAGLIDVDEFEDRLLGIKNLSKEYQEFVRIVRRMTENGEDEKALKILEEVESKIFNDDKTLKDIVKASDDVYRMEDFKRGADEYRNSVLKGIRKDFLQPKVEAIRRIKEEEEEFDKLLKKIGKFSKEDLDKASEKLIGEVWKGKKTDLLKKLKKLFDERKLVVKDLKAVMPKDKRKVKKSDDILASLLNAGLKKGKDSDEEESEEEEEED